MGTRKIAFSVFSIDQIVDSVIDLDVPQILSEILSHTSSVRERMMRLPESESGDSDFISKFKFGKDNVVFGSFLRLRESAESVLRMEDLDKPMIEISDVMREPLERSAGTVKDSLFFLAKDRYIILSNSHNNKKAFLAYMQWLFKNHGKNADFTFTPLHNKKTEIPIKEIVSIRLADSYIASVMDSQSFNLKRSILRSLMSDVDVPAEFDWDSMVSATLLVKMKRGALKRENALKTALRLTDSDDVTIIGKDGKRLNGSDYVVKVVRNIESTDGGYYNEPVIEGVMYEIIQKVKDSNLAN